MRCLNYFVLALALLLAACDSGDSDDTGDNGDVTTETSFNIQMESPVASSMNYSYACYDEEGSETGAAGSGTLSVSEGDLTTNLCSGFGLIAEATYDSGSAPIDVRIVTGPSSGLEVLAEETLQDVGSTVTFRLGTAPDS